DEVVDRRVPLPVEEGQGGERERERPARPQHGGGQRPGDERAQAYDVAAQRRRHHEGRRDRDRVERGAEPERARDGPEQHGQGDGGRQRGPEARGHERERPALGEGERERGGRPERGGGQRDGPPAAGVEPPGGGGQGQEGARHRARQARED